MINFYSFEEIRERGDCIQYATTALGCTVNSEGRVQALWRGGDGFNVSISRHEWYDHRAKVGGGILELCAFARHNENIQLAQNELGEWLRLEPTIRPKKLVPTSQRYDDLIAEGYVETKRYHYNDLDGNIVHFVARLEHPTKKKEFLQGTRDHWGLRDVKPILYRMEDWVSRECVAVVEGEKDADTLNEIGIPATTNCGGADKWRPEFAEQFVGKKVVIFEDNDDAGKAHSERVSRELKDVAEEIRIIRPSKMPKGDVTDWIESEGGNADALMALIRGAKPIDLSNLSAVDQMVESAKEANKFELRNYYMEKKVVGAEVKHVKHPRKLNDIIADVHKRFIGFPRKVGDSKSMFDHDRDSGEIHSIDKVSSLFAWMQLKSRLSVKWEKGAGYVEKGELFEGLHFKAIRYESISNVPDWPKREDVYYVHDKMPEPSEGYHYFNTFIDFFTVANAANKTLLKAFACAPLWYIADIPRPAWVMDSTDGAGCGKTTAVYIIARLYNDEPIKTTMKELKTKVEDITKRLVSTAGRLKRFFLADNLVGEVNCPELADFITSPSISGRSPYGRGEESRPNNLTYAITSNSAQLNNDLIDRSIFIHFAMPKRDPKWRMKVHAYMKEYRMHIIADMIGMLFRGIELKNAPQTRTPEFEETVIRGVCESEEEFQAAMDELKQSKGSSNAEEDRAQILEEGIREQLMQIEHLMLNQNIFITSAIFNRWVKWSCENDMMSRISVQDIKTYAKNGLLTRISDKPERMQHAGSYPRGMLWVGAPESELITKIITRGTGGRPAAMDVKVEVRGSVDVSKFLSIDDVSMTKTENGSSDTMTDKTTLF